MKKKTNYSYILIASTILILSGVLVACGGDKKPTDETTELNIEGNPKEQKFVDLVLETLPTQVTLVPDNLNQITSDHGWDTIKEQDYLKEIVSVFKWI